MAYVAMVTWIERGKGGRARAVSGFSQRRGGVSWRGAQLRRDTAGLEIVLLCAPLWPPFTASLLVRCRRECGASTTSGTKRCHSCCCHQAGQQRVVQQAQCKVVSDVVQVKPGRHSNPPRAGRWLAATRGRAILTLGRSRCRSSSSRRLSTLFWGTASSLGRPISRSRHHVGAGVPPQYGARRPARVLAGVGGRRGVFWWCASDTNNRGGHLAGHPEHPRSSGSVNSLTTFKRGQFVSLSGWTRQEPKHRVRRVRRQVQRQTLRPVYLRGLQEFFQKKCKKESNIFMSRKSELSNRSTSSESMPVLSTKNVPKNGHAKRSRAAGPCATFAASRHARTVRSDQWRRTQRAFLPLQLHLPAPSGRTVPDLSLRPVYATQQHHGHRQYLRTGREVTLQCGRVGPQHPLFPRPPSDGPGRALAVGLERTVRAERLAVLHAASRGTTPSRCGSSRISHGGGPSGCLHGPHSHLPRTSRETQGSPCRLCGVQLSQSHRALHHRCLRVIRRRSHRKFTRKISMRIRRILSNTISKSTYKIRQTSIEITFIEDCKFSGNRTAVFCSSCWQNSHRDFDSRYVAEWQLFFLALHEFHVTLGMASDRLYGRRRAPLAASNPGGAGSSSSSVAGTSAASTSPPSHEHFSSIFLIKNNEYKSV